MLLGYGNNRLSSQDISALLRADPNFNGNRKRAMTMCVLVAVSGGGDGACVAGVCGCSFAQTSMSTGVNL